MSRRTFSDASENQIKMGVGAELSRLVKGNSRLAIIVGFYTVSVGLIAIYRFSTGQTYAWDLGIFEQALYSFAFQGRLFYYTPEIFTINPSGLLFGIHFSPLMFALGVFYRALPYPQALLMLQSLVTALAVVPLRRICDLVGTDHKDLISFLYLANPLTVLSNLYDFHLEAFVPLFLLFLVLAGLQERLIPTIFWTLATLSIYEFAPILVISVFVCLLLLRHHLRGDAASKQTRLSFSVPRFINLLVVLSLLSVLYFWVALEVIHSFNPSLPLLTSGFALAQFQQNPISGVAYDLGLKVSYIVAPILVLALIPLREVRALVLSLPFLLLAVISNHRPFYTFGWQYGYLVIPGFAIATVFGVKFLHVRNVKHTRLFLRLTVVLTILLLSSSVLLASAGYDFGLLGRGAKTTLLTGENAAESRLISLIPQGVSVLVPDNAFPYLANSLDAYVIPTQFTLMSQDPYRVMRDILNRQPEFILFNTKEYGFFPSFGNFSGFLAANYGVYAEDDGNILLRLHFSGQPFFYSGYSEEYDASSFTSVNADSPYFWYGPYTTLIPGKYLLNLTYTSNGTGTVKFLITAGSGLKVLYASNLTVTPSGAHRGSATISFSSDWLYDLVEFRVQRTPNLDLSIIGATLQEVSE